MNSKRNCTVWIKYSGGEESRFGLVLDLDECVECQIRNKFECNNKRVIDFKWQENK